MASTEVAMGILQATIIAIPFWLTTIQYWLQQDYEEGDPTYNVFSAAEGVGASMALLALLLAVRYSTDAVLPEVGSEVTHAIRLIDLFTVVAFGLLVALIGRKMAEESNAKLALKYSMTFTTVAPLFILLYIFAPPWQTLVISFTISAVYVYVIHPRIKKFW